MNCYRILHILTNVFNFNKSLLMLTSTVFLHKLEIGIASFLPCLGVTTKDKVTLTRY